MAAPLGAPKTFRQLAFFIAGHFQVNRRRFQPRMAEPFFNRRQRHFTGHARHAMTMPQALWGRHPAADFGLCHFGFNQAIAGRAREIPNACRGRKLREQLTEQ